MKRNVKRCAYEKNNAPGATHLRRRTEQGRERNGPVAQVVGASEGRGCMMAVGVFVIIRA